MATTTLQIQESASKVLDEYAEQIEKEMAGIRVNKGATGSDSIIAALLPKLTTERQRKLLKTFPELSRFTK